MRVIGLDVGGRRIGVASGDTETGVAVPVGVIERTDDASAVAQVVEQAKARSAAVIVVGMPYSLSGRAGPQAASVAQFAELLRAAASLEVDTVDERLSTVEAERGMARFDPGGRGRRRRPKGDSDAGAAAVILQSWLDRQRGRRPS